MRLNESERGAGRRHTRRMGNSYRRWIMDLCCNNGRNSTERMVGHCGIVKLRRKSISYGHRGMFYCHCHSSDLIVGRIDMSVGHWIKWRTWSVTVRQFHSILVMSYVLETNAKQRRRCLLKVRSQSSRMWGVYYHNMFCIYIFTIADENLVAMLVWNGGKSKCPWEDEGSAGSLLVFVVNHNSEDRRNASWVEEEVVRLVLPDGHLRNCNDDSFHFDLSVRLSLPYVGFEIQRDKLEYGRIGRVTFELPSFYFG